MQYWFPEIAPVRVLFDFLGIQIQWYGVLVAAGVLAGLAAARSVYRKRGGASSDIVDAAWFAVIAGLVGARLWHVFIFQWGYYSRHISEIPQIWQGGIAIQGGILAGLLTVYLFARKRALRFVSLTDALAVGLPIGQAIGRCGNFFNQELYGLPTTLPWGIYIEPDLRIAGFEAFSRFHPTFFYESTLTLLLFLLLWQRAPREHRFGALTGAYLIGYGLIRFVMDFLRIDPMPVLFGLRYSQYISIAFLAIGILITFARIPRHPLGDGDEGL